MKIWKASMTLDYTDEFDYKLYFRVEKLIKNYTYFSDSNTYRYPDGTFGINNWMPAYIDEEFGAYYIIKTIQAFDKEPTEEELIDIKNKMKDYMKKKLIGRKEAEKMIRAINR